MKAKLTEQEVSQYCKKVTNTLVTMEQCLTALKCVENLVEVSDRTEENCATLLNTTTYILDRCSVMVAIGEENSCYAQMEEELSNEISIGGRISIVNKYDKIFSTYFPKSLLGIVILNTMKDEKVKLN